MVWERWKMALGRQERMARRSCVLCSRPVSWFQNTETSLCSKCSFCWNITQRTVAEECRASQIKIGTPILTFFVFVVVLSDIMFRRCHYFYLKMLMTIFVSSLYWVLQESSQSLSYNYIYYFFGLYVSASLALNQRHGTSCRSANKTRLLPTMSAAPPCHRSVTGTPGAWSKAVIF